MYGKIIGEHKLVAFYSLGITLLILVGLYSSNSKNILGLQAQQNTTITPGCYYKLNCPPNTSGSQSTFWCLPTLVCPTPSVVRSNESKTVLSCRDCVVSGNNTLCLDPSKKSSYCTRNKATASNVSCISCSRSYTTPPKCFPPPLCLSENPPCQVQVPVDGWCKPSPTPYFPTRAPTRSLTCIPLSCANPPQNCKYIGGDNCTTCGKLYCTTYPTTPVVSSYPKPTFGYPN